MSATAPADHFDDPEIALFELALTLPEEERAPFVRQATLHNPELAPLVLERLEWESRMGGFLQTPVLTRPDLEASLEAGAVLAGRFEIVRHIAEGGMALVYEAIDRMSGQTVALKIPKLPFRRRLLAELQSALEVTHPNLCRVHAIHRAEMPSGASFDFLTMEYLDGQTLAQKLATGPAPSLEEAAEIARQICAGLAEAHDRDVVHGDLKPGNIILTKHKSGRPRAVITDFGLAHISLATPMEAAPSLRGTPDFIAPELWRGATPSKASDIYALGVILYVLLTGQRPLQELPLSERLDSLPAAPHKLSPGVPIPWSGKVVACLSPTPDKRPVSPRDVAQVLAPPASRQRRPWAIAIAATLALACFLYWLTTIPAAPPTGLPLRLAILPPAADDDSTLLAIGIAEDWSTQLRSAPGSRPLSIIPVALAYRYHVKSPDQASAILGATHTLRLTTRARNNQISISGEIHAAPTQRRLSSWQKDFSLASLGEATPLAQTNVQSALSVTLASPNSVVPAAYAEHVRGLYFLNHVPNPQLAQTHLRQAQQQDPRSTLPLLRLAESELMSFRNGANAAALSSAQQHLDSALRLDARNARAAFYWRLRASLASAQSQPLEAEKALRQALSADAQDLQSITDLARHLSGSRRSAEAIELHRQATRVAPGYIQPLLELGVALYFAAKYDEAEKEYLKVIALAPDLSQAHQNLAAVYADTARYDLAEKQFQQALRLDRTSDTLAGMGAVLAYQGRHAESAQYYEQAVSLGPDDFLLVSNLGDSYRRTGRQNEARRAYSRALAAGLTALNSNPGSAYARAFVAYLNARLGQPKQANLEIRSALASAPADAKVCRRAVLTLEALGDVDAAFATLAASPQAILRELSRHPDLSRFRQDARFIQLSRAAAANAAK
jgi:eukaryotic-like serine/threonine-protein kinase